MTREEISAIVEEASSKAVVATLERLGIDTTNAPALRADMLYLRSWRLAMDSIRARSVLTFVTIVITGICGLIAMSFSRH